jgi:hypothetical protein
VIVELSIDSSCFESCYLVEVEGQVLGSLTIQPIGLSKGVSFPSPI